MGEGGVSVPELLMGGSEGHGEVWDVEALVEVSRLGEAM